jgi:hypothetical protein
MNTQQRPERLSILKSGIHELRLVRQPGGPAPYLESPPDSVFYDASIVKITITEGRHTFIVLIEKIDATGNREVLADPVFKNTDTEFAKVIRRLLTENGLL